ncbi:MULTISPECIES: TetR/AcrR family transcriptional regulator [Enterococcus]|uniref:HTH tetR-type domain-containing protein n=1 Tax=Candidatus Enterococcus mangumiae TaxID=2230878 RepID=A0ABZ2SY08_9ENTE|nr:MULTISPECIES: TetR/AcrR family transcriptional regulator [unclassified Enterococcus]MBO0490181.1 TetR/AcrR family transcriptional regulator [Enterococcus sp. DIV1094]MBO1298840.1 TetR/AcrR family transcriptional regulator [Enterococcus sp. DIV1271a]
MDRRSAKTKQAIKQAFLDLTKEKPINKITIAELSQQADIGRGTFYTHYEDIYDLRSKIIEESICILTDIFDQTYPKKEQYDFRNFVHALVNHVDENKAVFHFFFNDFMDDELSAQLTHILIKRVLDEEQLDEKDIKNKVEVLFSISGITNVLAEWSSGHLKVEKDELITILDDIITRF